MSFADEREDSFDREFIGGNEEHFNGRRRLSNLIDGKYPEVDVDPSLTRSRRKSEIERHRYATELVRAAHELMFTDTRPDGLRPITGTPMADGRTACGVGGLYVGISGLRGFDLSFIGAASKLPGTEDLQSVLSRLASRRSQPGAPEPSTRLTPAMPIPEQDSWREQGSLLDREPGSLIPTMSSYINSARTLISPGGAQEVEAGCKPTKPTSKSGTHGILPSFPIDDGTPARESEQFREKNALKRGRGDERRGVRGAGEVGSIETSAAATAIASLFAPKPAVLWSAANLGVEDIVTSAAARTHHRQVKYEPVAGTAAPRVTRSQQTPVLLRTLVRYKGEVCRDV